MNNTDLLIGYDNDGCTVKVTGRANFEYGVPLRMFAREFTKDVKQITVDLTQCTGMDSTFMGVLSMIGLKARKLGVSVFINNASESNFLLLKGLGVEKLFIFTEKCTDCPQEMKTVTVDSTELDTAQTVFDAHKTLVDADDANEKKFSAVIEFAEKDLKALKEKGKK